jgi:hypothetical protein
MTPTLIVDLVGKLAWPLVVLVLLFGYRRALLDLFGRARELEGPGGISVKLDKLEQIVAAGQRDGRPARDVANQIVEEAIVDERESRILRGLLGEKSGRLMMNYQSHGYRPALEALLARRWIVRNADGTFALTDAGTKVVVRSLRPLIEKETATIRTAE